MAVATYGPQIGIPGWKCRLVYRRALFRFGRGQAMGEFIAEGKEGRKEKRSGRSRSADAYEFEAKSWRS